MRKRLVLFFALALTASLIIAETKIGIINPQQVLYTAIKGKEVVKKLNEFANQNKIKYDEMQKKLDSLEKEVNSPALNQDSRDKKNAELTRLKTEQQRFYEDYQNEMGRRQQAEFESMQKELLPIIEGIAKSKGYSLILEVGTTGIAYATPEVDITNEVIKAYDAMNPAQKPAAPKPQK